MMLTDVLKWVADNPEKSIPLILSVTALIFGGLWTALTFIHKAILESKDRELIAYQKVIEVLNKGKDGDVFIDYQLDSVFQLRFFTRYFPRSLRLIDRLITRWTGSRAYENMQIIEELESTKKYIKIRQSPLSRLFAGIVCFVWPWL